MAWKPKYPPDVPKPPRRSFEALVGLAVVLAIVVIAVGAERLMNSAQSPIAASSPRTSTTTLPTIVTQPNESNFITVRPGGSASAVQHGTFRSDITIVDGDTVRSGGLTYRLVGFDAPERGDRALCDKERELAEKAFARLRALIAGGEPILQRVACACRTGTEGMQTCEAGRACAYLRVSGKDVGEILIREGHARPYICGATSCPPRKPWC